MTSRSSIRRGWRSSGPPAVTPPPCTASPGSRQSGGHDVDGRVEATGTEDASAPRGPGVSGAGQAGLSALAGPVLGSTLGTTRCLLVASGRCGPRRAPRIPPIPDTRNVDSMFGRDTVTTLPEATMALFEDQGRLVRTIDVLARPRTRCDDSAVGVDMDDVGLALETERVW
jgi:transaldolase